MVIALHLQRVSVVIIRPAVADDVQRASMAIGGRADWRASFPTRSHRNMVRQVRYFPLQVGVGRCL